PLRRGIAAGALSLEVDAEGPGDLSRLEARARLAADGLVLRGARLAAEPVGPLDLGASGTAAVDVRRGRATFAGDVVSLADALRVGVEAEASLAPGVPFSLALRARGVDYRAAVAALPAALAPPQAAPRPAGTLDAALDASGPLLRPAEWTISASLDLSRLREAGRAEPPVELRGPFVHRARAARGEVRVAVGPANPDFVPLAALPAHVVRAVTTSEDAGFFGHQGFDVGELRNAFAEAAEAGRLGRGGSTITQQLAKNLYLDGERTLARKVREAAVAIALEATLPKARILEIYVNVVEWGPGVRGIGAAARHWFGKDARDLSPREAAFLASILPSPVRSHAMYARGEPSPAWYDRVDALLLKMGEQGALSEDELERALEQPIVFARG
ncbi:MAG TPA: biosynthetic peptidoglycan transglycosylase, partial [Anaeromyxobacter sp.]